MSDPVVIGAGRTALDLDDMILRMVLLDDNMLEKDLYELLQACKEPSLNYYRLHAVLAAVMSSPVMIFRLDYPDHNMLYMMNQQLCEMAAEEVRRHHSECPELLVLLTNVTQAIWRMANTANFNRAEYADAIASDILTLANLMGENGWKETLQLMLLDEALEAIQHDFDVATGE